MMDRSVRPCAVGKECAGLAQPTGECLVNPRLNEQKLALHVLIEHFAIPMDLGEELTIRGRHANLGDWSPNAECRHERSLERFQPTFCSR